MTFDPRWRLQANLNLLKKNLEVQRNSGTWDKKHKGWRQEPVPPVCAEEWSPGPTERAELGEESGWAQEGSEVNSAGSESAGTRLDAEKGW